MSTLSRTAPQRRASVATRAAAALLLAGTIVFLWRAPGSYEVYKALHVAFAVVWVGAGAALTLLGLLAERSPDPRELATIVRYAETIGQRVFPPAGLAVAAFGAAMVERAGWGWGSFWIDFALAVFALSFLAGAGYLGPTGKKLRHAYEASGSAVSAEVDALQRRILRVARFETVLLLLVVVDMVAKPVF